MSTYTVTGPVTANFGDTISADMTSGPYAITLPAPSLGSSPITIIKSDVTANVLTAVLASSGGVRTSFNSPYQTFVFTPTATTYIITSPTVVTQLIAGANITLSGSTGVVTVSSSGGGGSSPYWVPWQFPVGAASGGDDSTAILAASASAVAYAAANNGYAEVIFTDHYKVTNAPSTAYSGNAQLPLPLHATTANKLTLVWRGIRDASALLHWQQTTPQISGVVIETTYSAGSTPSFGNEPVVIGGPNPYNGYGEDTSTFTNILFVLDGIEILLPNDPHVCGIDLRGVAEANIPNAAVMVRSYPGSITVPTQAWQFGLFMPAANNNDNANIGLFSCEGMNYGCIVSEHTTVQSLRAIYCTAGLVVEAGSLSNAGSITHGILVQYASVESCTVGLELYNSTSPTKISVACLDWEPGTGGWAPYGIINDPNGVGIGTVTVRCMFELNSGVTVLRGTTALRIYNEDQASGIVSESVPATNTAYTMPFWRDATAYITAGSGSTCVVKIDGTTVFTIPASGVQSVYIPSGHTITLVYTSTPTWVLVAH